MPGFGHSVFEPAGEILQKHPDRPGIRGKFAATTFCDTPAILYAMDIVPATFEILTTIGAQVWKLGMFDYMDYCCEVGIWEYGPHIDAGRIKLRINAFLEQISGKRQMKRKPERKPSTQAAA